MEAVNADLRASHHGHMLALTGRFELPTSGSGDQRSFPLS